MINPTGYYILIELEEVDEMSEGGIVMYSKDSQEREQRGHHRGVVRSFGPLAFTGYKGIEDSLPVEERAKAWGVEVGNTIECGRYAGEMVQKEGIDRFTLIPDQKILGVYSGGE